jgi:hypothetical protein
MQSLWRYQWHRSAALVVAHASLGGLSFSIIAQFHVRVVACCVCGIINRVALFPGTGLGERVLPAVKPEEEMIRILLARLATCTLDKIGSG